MPVRFGSISVITFGRRHKSNIQLPLADQLHPELAYRAIALWQAAGYSIKLRGEYDLRATVVWLSSGMTDSRPRCNGKDHVSWTIISVQ